MSKETIIGMPPGVGDLHWIMAKLESFKEKNNIDKIKVAMNLEWHTVHNIHKYSLDYLKLIPFIDSAESVVKDIEFEYALTGKGSGKPLFKNHGDCDYAIEFNSQLEKGVKLENILPEYETNFDYPITRPPEAEELAESIREDVGEKLVLFFCASVAGNNVWAQDLWTQREWMLLAKKIYEITKCRLVLIGATWDGEYARILDELDADKIIINLTGKTSIAQLFALLRTADVVVAFQCGVLMMAIHFRTPSVAFWPLKNKANPAGPFDKAFMHSWIPPWAEAVGYMPFAFGDATPGGVFNAIRRYL